MMTPNIAKLSPLSLLLLIAVVGCQTGPGQCVDIPTINFEFAGEVTNDEAIVASRQCYSLHLGMDSDGDCAVEFGSYTVVNEYDAWWFCRYDSQIGVWLSASIVLKESIWYRELPGCNEVGYVATCNDKGEVVSSCQSVIQSCR
jgi:hypothetical protein